MSVTDMAEIKFTKYNFTKLSNESKCVKLNITKLSWILF